MQHVGRQRGWLELRLRVRCGSGGAVGSTNSLRTPLTIKMWRVGGLHAAEAHEHELGVAERVRRKLRGGGKRLGQLAVAGALSRSDSGTWQVHVHPWKSRCGGGAYAARSRLGADSGALPIDWCHALLTAGPAVFGHSAVDLLQYSATRSRSNLEIHIVAPAGSRHTAFRDQCFDGGTLERSSF